MKKEVLYFLISLSFLFMVVTLITSCQSDNRHTANNKEIDKHQRDTAYINALLDSVMILRIEEDTIYDKISQQAYELSKELNYIYGMAKSMQNSGFYRVNYGRGTDTARTLLTKSLSLFESINLPTYQVDVLIDLGFLETNVGDYDKALRHLYGAVTIADSFDYQFPDRIPFYLARVYYHQKGYLKSIELLQESAELSRRQTGRDPKYALKDIARAYWEIQQYDSAKHYWLQAVELYQETTGVVYAGFWTYLAGCYEALDDRDSTAIILDLAIATGEQLDDMWGLSFAHTVYGKHYLKIGQLEKAEQHYLEGLNFSQRSGELFARRESYDALITLYKTKNDFQKAFEYQQKSIAIKDSIFSSEKAKQIRELDQKFGTERKERENAQLRIEEEHAQASLKSQKIVIYLTTLVLFFFAVLAVVFFRAKRQTSRANELLKEKNEEITTQGEQLIKSQERIVMSEKMAALGQLMSSIAHEINTPLGAISASIETLALDLGKENKDASENLIGLNEELVKLFSDFLQESFHQSKPSSFREKRGRLKDHINQIQEEGIEDAEGKAERLIDNNVFEIKEQFLPVLASTNLFEHALLKISQNQSVSNIQLAVEKVKRMMFAIKSYSHKDQNETKRKVHLVAGIQSVVELYKSQLKLGVDLIEDYGEVPEFLGFPDKLDQVWTNLIQNALQAMNFEGTLNIRCFKKADEVHVEIQDSGPGIPTEIQDKIFEPFFTTKKAGEGSGLGLDIIKRIIADHAGEITFTSKPGETVFSVTIPV